MSKILAMLILTTLTLLPGGASWLSTPSTLAAQEMEVTVLFSGLMVFNFNKKTQAYEVGILGPDHAAGHEFCIQRQAATRLCRNDLPKGTKWTLTVTNPPPNAKPVANGHDGKRRPDTEPGQNDFDWIVDLDGPGFHNKKLELAPGHLKPIIQLPKVALFTKYKSPDFVRWQGDKPASPPVFGFVSESIAFRVKLRKGDTMVMKDDETGQTVFTVAYTPPNEVGGNSEVISISNIRPSSNDELSDFRMYYDLFPEVAESEQFDFAENRNNPVEPKNLLPGYETCCSLLCTEVRLVNWDQPLH